MRSKAIILILGGLAALVLMAWFVSIRMGGNPMPTAPDAAMTRGIIADMKNAVGGSGLPVLAERMPEFSDVTAWLNSPALTSGSLKGKVVLIDFWTYSCINCIRTLPYVTSWHDKYQDKGLTVVGVHAPEFAFEKSRGNVEAAIARHGIRYPVAMDNEFGTWNNYDNQYWPAKYLFDAQGRLRYTHFGEGRYDETEAAIQALLLEAGMEAAAPMSEFESTVDFIKLGSLETYLGYQRQNHFASSVPVLRDKPQDYVFPEVTTINRFSLSGRWRVESERAVLEKATGAILYFYDASSANLVMGSGSGGGTVRAVVTLDGKPVPPEFRGADIVEKDGKTYVMVGEHRLYSLTDAKGDYGEHVLRIDFLDAGVECYAFTFG